MYIMVYLPMNTIKINHPCIGKYTIVPWIPIGFFKRHGSPPCTRIGSKSVERGEVPAGWVPVKLTSIPLEKTHIEKAGYLP